jgi:uncharacterized protein YkwD
VKTIAVLLVVPVLLAACGERATIEPPPLAVAPAPDTSQMGAAGSTGVLGAGPARLACGPQVAAEEVLRRINAARASGHRCGRRAMGPVSPLQWNASLQTAAQGHSLDMAKRNYYDHRSPEGGNMRSRLSAVHYKSRMVGENLAAGVRSVPEALQAWLDSPEHCENLMHPEFNEVAVACAARPGSQWGTYWTMVLGRK